MYTLYTWRIHDKHKTVYHCDSIEECFDKYVQAEVHERERCEHVKVQYKPQQASIDENDKQIIGARMFKRELGLHLILKELNKFDISKK